MTYNSEYDADDPHTHCVDRQTHVVNWLHHGADLRKWRIVCFIWEDFLSIIVAKDTCMLMECRCRWSLVKSLC